MDLFLEDSCILLPFFIFYYVNCSVPVIVVTTVCVPFIVPDAFVIVGPAEKVYPADGVHVVEKVLTVKGEVPVCVAPVKLPPSVNPEPSDGPP